MDGTMDVESQIRLMRAVIGRKIMEIDDCIDKAEQNPEAAGAYESLIEFLKNDVLGYKNLVDDLQDETGDYKGNYCCVSSLSERMVGLYNDFYLPSLSDEDVADEEQAMALKEKYAVSLIENRYVRVGKAALDSPLVIALMNRNPDIMAVIGKIVLSEPELISALNDEL